MELLDAIFAIFVVVVFITMAWVYEHRLDEAEATIADLLDTLETHLKIKHPLEDLEHAPVRHELEVEHVRTLLDEVRSPRLTLLHGDGGFYDQEKDNRT